jgi:hypothetical protein
MAVYTRAHETGADLLERPGRCNGGRRRRRLRFSETVLAEIRGDDGALAIGASADAAVASGGEVRGHQQIIGNSSALT